MAKRKKKANAVLQPDRIVQASEPSSAASSEAYLNNGVSQPVDDEGCRILLVDAGWIPRSVPKHFHEDLRLPAEHDDIVETAQQFNARCIVGTDFKDEKPPNYLNMHRSSRRNAITSWHVWHDPDSWTLLYFELRTFSDGMANSVCMSLLGRQCAILHLRYHDGTLLRVMVVKNVQGTAAAPDALQMDPLKRQQVLEIIFDFILYGVQL